MHTSQHQLCWLFPSWCVTHEWWVRRTGLLTWFSLVEIESMSIWPRRDNDPLAELSIKMDLLSAFQCCLSRAITQRNALGGQLRSGSLSWRLDLGRNCCYAATSLSVYLTVKQVFLQLDKRQHIHKTTYAAASAGVSCFGPVSPLRLAVLQLFRLWVS